MDEYNHCRFEKRDRCIQKWFDELVELFEREKKFLPIKTPNQVILVAFSDKDLKSYGDGKRVFIY